MSRELRPLTELLAQAAQAEETEKELRRTVSETQSQLGAWRRARGASQSYVALSAGTSQAFVSMVENGDRSATPDQLKAMYSAISDYEPDGSNDDTSTNDLQAQAKKEARRRRSK